MKIIIAGFLFILSIFLIGQNLDKPFWGEHDWNGVRYGNIARNYLRYGFLETKLGQVENSGSAKRSEFAYYTHYPPLLPILLSASYKLFGISEWSTRIVPLLATAGGIVLIFLIGSTWWDFKRGLTAALLALATPLVLYFGKNPVHEPLTLFFILLSLWGYLKYHQTNQKKFQLVFLIGLIFAQMTAWAGYFLLPAITVSLLLRKDLQAVKKLIPYWGLSTILFLIHFIHIAFLTGSFSGGNLLGSLLQRSGLASDVQPAGFNLISYLNKLRLWFSTLLTITLSLLALAWLIIRKGGISSSDWSIFSLGLLGFIYISLFSSSVFIHNYLIFYFLPPLSLAGSACIIYLLKLRLLNRVRLFLPILFLLLIFLERKSFLDALNSSNSDKMAVEIGKSINSQTLPSDVIVVSPIKYSYSAEKFLKFYSDRKLIFADDSNLDYDYIVAVNQDLGTFQISKK